MTLEVLISVLLFMPDPEASVLFLLTHVMLSPTMQIQVEFELWLIKTYCIWFLYR
jgi:hypothetical protein